MVLPAPTQDTFTVGEILTAALMNKNVRDAVDFLQSPPFAVLWQNTAQSIPNNNATPINFDSEIIDSYGGHSNTTNPAQYKPQVPGYYFILGAGWFSANATGYRRLDLYVNGVTVTPQWQTTESAFSTGAGMQVCGFQYMNVGDYLQLQGTQNSGGALSTPGGGACSLSLWLMHS